MSSTNFQDVVDQYEDHTITLLMDNIDVVPDKGMRTEYTRQAIIYFRSLRNGVGLILEIDSSLTKTVDKVKTVWKNASTFQPIVETVEEFTSRLLLIMDEQQKTFQTVNILFIALRHLGFDKSSIDRNALLLTSVEEKVLLILSRFTDIFKTKAVVCFYFQNFFF